MRGVRLPRKGEQSAYFGDRFAFRLGAVLTSTGFMPAQAARAAGWQRWAAGPRTSGRWVDWYTPGLFADGFPSRVTGGDGGADLVEGNEVAVGRWRWPGVVGMVFAAR